MVKTGTLLRVLGSQPAAATAAQEAARYSAFKLIKLHLLFPKMPIRLSNSDSFLAFFIHLVSSLSFMIYYCSFQTRPVFPLFFISLYIFYTFRMYENAICQLLYLIITSYSNVYVLGRSSWNLGCARIAIYIYI